MGRIRVNVAERFWSKVEKSDDPDGCWLWTAGLNNMGYARFRHNGRDALAHRVVWAILGEPIPDEILACHTCDNPRCIRPSHHFLGTQTDNMRDCSAKHRCRSGQEWAEVTRPALALAHQALADHPEKRLRGDRHWMRFHPERIARGERQGGAKLTAAAVCEIRQAVANRTSTQRELALRFGVCPATICLAVKEDTWQHVGASGGH